MNVTVIFMAKGTNGNHRLRGKNLVIIYILSKGYCVITNKVSCMDDETWVNVVKVVAPGIRKMKVINVACVLPILLFIYLTLLYAHS